jgi:Domain of unknown function (DUF1841)
MFSPSRDQARRFFYDTWGRYERGEALSGLEQVALETLLLHPEYHALLRDPERHLERDYTPEDGGVNPFLHLSLHLAVAEQLSIDQPAGIRAAFEELRRRLASQHDALHAVLECLGETLWQAQRQRSAPDERAYLDCLTRSVRGR